MECVGIPLVLAIVALPLVRKGPVKDWLVRILLLVPVTFSLFMIPGFFLVKAIVLYRSGAIALYRSGRLASDDPDMLVIVGCVSFGCIIVLGFVFALLLRRVVPGRCPECQLPTLLPTVPTQPKGTKVKVYQCLCCEGQFQKLGGAWTASSPELESAPGSR